MSETLYHPTKTTLFLLISSGTKVKDSGYFSGYQPETAVALHLTSTAALLYDTRDAARCLMESVTYHGESLATSPSNRELAQGPDFGGDAPARYCPALHLYAGRFYKMGLGDEGIHRLFDSGSHALILSGLYGVVAPEESLQLYECPLEDISAFSALWRKDNLLTKMLLDYCRTCGIETVVDLTADSSYRHLIVWDLLNQAGIRALHAHHNEFVGDAALPVLGAWMANRLLLMTDEDFSAIDDTFFDDDCCLTVSLAPPAGWPADDCGPIEAAISAGETRTTEFKESLTGWGDDLPIQLDYNETKFGCMKTLVAMMNTDGGSLYIGVLDTKEVLGVEGEMDHVLGRSGNAHEPEDLFRQIFDQMIIQYIGKIFLQYLRPAFVIYGGRKLMVVTISRSVIPAFLKKDDRGREKTTAQYWIRGNAGNRKLDALQREKWMATHDQLV